MKSYEIKPIEKDLRKIVKKIKDVRHGDYVTVLIIPPDHTEGFQVVSQGFSIEHGVDIDWLTRGIKFGLDDLGIKHKSIM